MNTATKNGMRKWPMDIPAIVTAIESSTINPR